MQGGLDVRWKETWRKRDSLTAGLGFSLCNGVVLYRVQFKRISVFKYEQVRSSMESLEGRTAKFFFPLWCRYADSSSYPNVDTSNQVTNEQVTRENGQLRVSFTIPCRSTDTRDVPYEGLHYLLFATGAVVGDDITYHGNTRWHTDGPLQLTCGGGYWREFFALNWWTFTRR